MRKTPRTTTEIREGIGTVLRFARKDLEAVHLVPADFEVADRNPEKCGLTKQDDGRLVRGFNGRLIEVLPVAK